MMLQDARLGAAAPEGRRLMTETTTTVGVSRHPSGGRLRAEYRLTDHTRLHWSGTSGGTMSRTNQLYIHGYVMCDQMLSGDLDHSCEHGPPPHRIKVCVVAVDNEPAVMKLLKSQLEPKPMTDAQRRRMK
jgi:hypothetical protein